MTPPTNFQLLNNVTGLSVGSHVSRALFQHQKDNLRSLTGSTKTKIRLFLFLRDIDCGV